MKYLLVTGPTGMLGQYLLRDLSLARLPIAVLVRPRTVETARSRIERVLQDWERRTGRNLPRPVVLSGDLQQPQLALSRKELDWIRGNCDAVLHAAASVTFYEDSVSGEPYRSNTHGTRHLLDLCRAADIRNFHHVSTAYVCGQGSGRVLEEEIASRAEFGNDYERSKAQAERLVREATCLERATVFRPSVVVGDSQTGHAPAFHGIYTSLQLGYLFLLTKLREGASLSLPLVKHVVEESFIQELGLSGTERKNLVPVDWVSAAIVRLIRSGASSGIYHLTNPQPVAIGTLAEAMIQAVLATAETVSPSTVAVPPGLFDTDRFRDHMDVYRSYYRDDPSFDATHTVSALPDLPCPVLDRQSLIRLWRQAIDANFGSRLPQAESPDLNCADRIGKLPPAAAGKSYELSLEVSGPGGGAWRIGFADSLPVCATPGVGVGQGAEVYLRGDTLTQLVGRDVSAEQALFSGALVVRASAATRAILLQRLECILEWLATPDGIRESTPSSIALAASN